MEPVSAFLFPAGIGVEAYIRMTVFTPYQRPDIGRSHLGPQGNRKRCARCGAVLNGKPSYDPMEDVDFYLCQDVSCQHTTGFSRRRV